MPEREEVTLYRLEGGTKWHCAGVDCRYVGSADLPLSSEGRTVYWDGEQVRASEDDEPAALADVCNHCQLQLGWTSAEERFAAARERHGDTSERTHRSRPLWRRNSDEE
jgi:hypothetical protein